MVEISEYTYLSTAAQRRTINKCLCCLPFHSEQQILSSSSHAVLARKGFFKTEDVWRTDRKNAQNYFFVSAEEEERRPGRARPCGLLIFDVALGPY